ncbi:MAG: hypothetical protein QM691_04880 [Opitutaceae bacterium]
MRSIFAPLLFAGLVLADALPTRADLVVRTQLYAVAPDTSRASADSDATASTGFRHFRAPTDLEIGGATLRLGADSAAWATPQPASIRSLADALLPVGPTGNAVLRCIAKAQYLEPTGNGTFELRQIPADAPDVPRYVLTFRIATAARGQRELAASCDLEIGVARRREPLPGIDMPVGRPQVDVRTAETTFVAPFMTWQALLFRQSPDTTSLLAVFRIEETPAKTGSDGARASHLIKMNIAATRTPSGTVATQARHGDAPIGYLFFDAGYGQYGTPVAGMRPPTPTAMQAAWQSALDAAGYQPAHPSLPPRVVLVQHWGFSYVVRDANFGNRSVSASAAPEQIDSREKAFVILSAYDYADFAAGQRTLLWRVRADTRDIAPLAEVLPGLVRASASWLGRHEERPHIATVDLSAQAPSAAAPIANAPEFLRAIDETLLRSLAEQGSRIISRRSDLPVSPEEQTSKVPLRTGPGH